MNRTLVARAVILVGVVLAIATPAVALAQTNDTFTADSVTCAGTGACEVNVYLKDVAGTPIGSDQAAHKKIDQLAFVVAYTATTASCMDSTTPFFRTTNGILQPIILDGPPSLVTSKPKVQFTSQGYVFSISEADVATGVPTNTATASPGDLLGSLVFTLTSCAGGVVPLTFTTAALSSDDNTTETVDTVAGQITVQVAGPTSTPTNTPAAPTATPTNTPQGPTATPTNTPQGPTATPTNTPQGPTATPTNTPVVPTATPTNTPVASTATPTNTPVVPTATPTNTPIVGPLGPTAIPTLDHRALAALAVLLAAAGLMLTKRLLK